MLDISVTAQKAKNARDPYAPLELSNEGPPKLAGTALLSDKQASFLGDFVSKHLPAHQRDGFRKAVLSRLSDGRPGDAAVKQAMRIVALDEFGFTPERLAAVGLVIVQDRANDRRRAALDDRPPRPRRHGRQGKHA